MKQNKATHTTVETIGFSRKDAMGWGIPPFQRPLRVNDKVKAVAEQIKSDGGVIPGIITFGVLEKRRFIIDGQHRREAFVLSEMEEGYADARTCYFESMADMGEEFVNLNSHLVVMRPDDVLRGLESSLPALALIREKCPFVGYDQLRRDTSSPLVSMSAILRVWRSSAGDLPAASSGNSASHMAKTFSVEEAETLCRFLNLAMRAWGKDPEYNRLWLGLNLTLCAWLYRGIVIKPYSVKTQKISDDQFCKCLMALSADSLYMDWLLGRRLGDRDRSPAYARLKKIFAARLLADTGNAYKLPAPAWATGH